MTPRQRIRAALAHREPDRVPFSWGFGPTAEMTAVLRTYLGERGLDWDRLQQVTEDRMGIGADYLGPAPAPGTDLWGMRRKPQAYAGGTYEELCAFPLAGITDPAALDRYPWPDPEAYDDAGLRAKALAADPNHLRAWCCGGGNPFEIYCWLTGLEEALVNLIVQPDVVRAALEHITRFFERRLERTLDACADLLDMVFFADDLGSQTGLLMSRETYRAVLQPYHRRLTALVHRRAPHAACMLHSDGAVFDIIPDLLDAGIDLLEAVQTDAAGMDPARLKQAYGARLCFQGGISVQQLLPRADAATVEHECRRLVEILGRSGGYIAAPAHAIQVGTPPENVLAMLRGVLGAVDYAAALAQAARPG